MDRKGILAYIEKQEWHNNPLFILTLFATMTCPDDELPPNQAADFLNISRSYLDRLLEQGDIPARNRGAQCRLRLRDVLEYKERSQRLRTRCLDELAAQAQNLDMGY